MAADERFRLGKWDGSLEGLVDYFTLDTETTGAQDSEFERLLTQERIRLNNRGGFIYDPRFLRYSVNTLFGLNQEKFSTNGDDQSSDTTLEGYALFASILPLGPSTLNLEAERDKSFFSRELGGRTIQENENYEATLLLKGIYIPSTFRYSDERRELDSRTANSFSRRDEREKTFEYRGERGWLNSQMAFEYEYIDFMDVLLPNLDFESHDVDFRYSLDFGPELNRRWDSDLRYFERSGVSDLTTVEVRETLRVEHSEDLQTRSRYSFTRFEVEGGETDAHQGLFTLDYIINSNLDMTVDMESVYQKFQTGNRQSHSGDLEFNYVKGIPRNGVVNVSLEGGLTYDKNDFATSQTLVPQEPHTFATPVALPIALNNRFVIVSTVVVTKTATGPLPVGCIAPPAPPILLVEGQDYLLETNNDVTEIVPIPCAGTTPGINPGDTIAVDYQFTVSPSRETLENRYSAFASVSYGWIRVFGSHSQSNENLLSGRDEIFLDDRVSDKVGIELIYKIPWLRAGFLAEEEFERSTRERFDSLRLRQTLSATLTPRLRLTANATQEFTEFERPRERDRTTLTNRAALNYTPFSGLFLNAFAEYIEFRDSTSDDQRSFRTGASARWFIRRVEVIPSVEFFRQDRGNVETREFQAVLRVIRRF